jgi:uncharacterized surface protein with fasciclin (FAS1) repeats
MKNLISPVGIRTGLILNNVRENSVFQSCLSFQNSKSINKTKKIMKKLIQTLLPVMALLITVSATAQKKDIVDIAAGSEAHTTLVAAVKAAELVATLKSAGPFTVFAPVNDAFAKLPAGTVDNLLKAENKATLAKILTYHVVAGNLDAAAVLAAIKKGNGSFTLTTVSGGQLTASLDDGKVKLTDEKGGSAYVTVTDLKGSNGVIHVIDSVVLPK